MKINKTIFICISMIALFATSMFAAETTDKKDPASTKAKIAENQEKMKKKADEAVQSVNDSLQTIVKNENVQIEPADETRPTRFENPESGFTPHKSNYINVVSFQTSNFKDYNKEIIFQFSGKQRLFSLWNFGFYVGYSQKSFWQAYAISDSRPFRENNFNPEFFIRTPRFVGDTFGRWSIDLGVEHESNGQKIQYSRSWNRIYFTPTFQKGPVFISLKTWYRFKENPKTSPSDPTGDDNPDILDYYGYNDLTVKILMGKMMLAATGRFNFVTRRGGVAVDLSYPFFKTPVYWQLHYWEGYGESLIDYNNYQRRIGIGIILNR